MVWTLFKIAKINKDTLRKSEQSALFLSTFCWIFVWFSFSFFFLFWHKNTTNLIKINCRIDSSLYTTKWNLKLSIFIVRIKCIILILIVLFIWFGRSFLLTHLSTFQCIQEVFHWETKKKEQIENSSFHNCWFVPWSVSYAKKTQRIPFNVMTWPKNCFFTYLTRKKTFLIKHNWNGNAIFLGGQMEVKYFSGSCLCLCTFPIWVYQHFEIVYQ